MSKRKKSSRDLVVDVSDEVNALFDELAEAVSDAKSKWLMVVEAEGQDLQSLVDVEVATETSVTYYGRAIGKLANRLRARIEAANKASRR